MNERADRTPPPSPRPPGSPGDAATPAIEDSLPVTTEEPTATEEPIAAEEPPPTDAGGPAGAGEAPATGAEESPTAGAHEGPATGASEGPGGLRVILSPWAIPIVLLTALWLLLAFSSGGFLERQWLLPGIAVAAFGVVAGVLIAYPRRPRQLSIAVLLPLAAYAVWVALSAVWAPSRDAAWEEAARTFLYVVTLALALAYLTDAGARRALRYLFVAGALALVVITVWRISTTAVGAAAAGAAAGSQGAGRDLAMLFFGNRFAYPSSYPNNAAAQFLVLFWPVLWVASDPRERAPVRGVAMAACWGLVGLAILTQSRGGLWAMGITCVVTFALSPTRLRTLFYLLVPAALTVWAFPDLDSYWLEGPAAVGPRTAVWVISVGMGVAALTCVALALLENWIRVSRRMKVVFGAGVLLVVAGLLVYGTVVLDDEVGDPIRWLQDAWDDVRGDVTVTMPGVDASGGDVSEGGGSGGAGGEQALSRYATLSGNGRWDFWRVAWQDFTESPWTGQGAGSFASRYLLARRLPSEPRHAHSIEMQTLGDTGAVGGVLLFGALLVGLVGMTWPRFAAGWAGLRRRHTVGRWGADPRVYAWEFYLALGVLYWLAHGSVEWLFQMPGVTLPALLMFALGVASVDARAGVLWPRLAAFLPHLYGLIPFLTPPMVVMMKRRRGDYLRPPEPAEAGSTPAGGPAEDQGSGSPSTEGRDETGPSAAATVVPLDHVLAVDPVDLGPFPDSEGSFSVHRRADRHARQRRRRERREARRRRRTEALQPPGATSRWFRYLLVTASLVTLVGLALPYVSLRLQTAAAGTLGVLDEGGLRNTEIAAVLQPFDDGPLTLRAELYKAAARAAAGEGRADEAIDAWALALEAYTRAIRRDPATWSPHYQAGRATLALSDLREGVDISSFTPIRLPVTDDEARRQAAAFRALSPDDLRLLARSYFAAAQARNPGSGAVAAALASLPDD